MLPPDSTSTQNWCDTLSEKLAKKPLKLRPAVEKAVNLANSPNAPWNSKNLLGHPASIVRNKSSMCNRPIHEGHLETSETCKLSLQDLERSINILPLWYTVLKYHFRESSIDIALDDPVYVSRASIKER